MPVALTISPGNPSSSEEPRTVTIPEAAALLGISEKAVRRRIERKTLPCVMGHDGKRRIPRSALPAAPPGHPDTGLQPLIARLEQLAGDAARHRLITDGAERREHELMDALHEARARATAAEARAQEAQAELEATRSIARRRRWMWRGRAPQ